jgi:geranylgeranyl reductase family protein
MYDVIVVGLGPAGATAAYELARKGFRVIAIDRKRFPRYKPCGGGVTAKVEKVIGSDFKEVVERDIYKIGFTFRGEDSIIIESNHPVAYLVMRDKFDHYLMQKAKEAGVKIIEGKKVTGVGEEEGGVKVVARDGVYYSQFAVGSDGANSIVASSTGLKLRRRVAVLLDGELIVEKALLSEYNGHLHFDFGSVPCGYGWIFPKKDVLSVGIGSLRGKTKKLRKYYDYFLEEQEIAGRVVSEKRYGSLLPVFDGVSKLSTNRILLTGDAASLADPFTGEGIYYAVKSARIGGEVLERVMDGDMELREYDVRVAKEICSELEYARRLSMIFHFSPRKAYSFLKENQELMDAVLKLAREENSYSVLWKLIRKKAGFKLDAAWKISELYSFFVG